VLYVALTRAVDSVFLSWVGKPAANSWASMLRWDLSPGVHTSEAYTYVVEDAVAAPSIADISAVKHEVPRKEWRSVTDTEVRVRQNTSVTEILDRSAAILGTRDVLTIPVRLKLAAQGTAVHRLLEALKSPSTESVRNLVKRWFPGKEEKVTKAVAYVTSVSEPPLSDLIKNGFVEWGFAFLHNGVLIEGQIDLWGREGKTVWVADYKTGSPEGREKAFKQLALYALALRKGGEIKKDDTVRLAAVYPFAEKIFIEDEPALDYYDKIFTPN
jgi:ATP-dependent exoDNAse (exonuclease V) beta subunit